MTMAIDARDLPEAKERIQKFRRDLCHFFERSGHPKEVYHLTVSLYPVTIKEEEG